MSSKFKALFSIDVTSSSRYFKKVDIPGQVEPLILELAPAMSCNKPYQQAKLKQMAKNAKNNRDVDMADIDEALMDEVDEQNRHIIATTVLKGWENNPGEDGDIEYSPDNALDFMSQCPDWLLEDICEEAANKDKFIARSKRLRAGGKEELIKN